MYPEQSAANGLAEEEADQEERNEKQMDAARELQQAEMKIYADRQKVVVNKPHGFMGYYHRAMHPSSTGRTQSRGLLRKQGSKV